MSAGKTATTGGPLSSLHRRPRPANFLGYAWRLEPADLREMVFDLSLIEFADRVPAKTKNQDQDG